MLIDPPSPFAPTEDWLEFEAEVKTLDQTKPEVQWALEQIAQQKERQAAEKPEGQGDVQVYLIDPPEMWAPMAEWEQFAEEIKDLPKDHPQVAAALKRVEQRRERDREMMDEKPPMQGYTAIIEAASDGTFGVFFPDLPGCTSAGDTIEEATTNAAEVMEFHLENMDDWPAPTDPASIVVHSDVIEVARIQVPAPAR